MIREILTSQPQQTLQNIIYIVISHCLHQTLRDPHPINLIIGRISSAYYEAELRQGGHAQVKVNFPVFSLSLHFLPVYFKCKKCHILICKWPPSPH